MTISYAGNFATLLLRWRGSIWKSVWKELFGFLTIYAAIRLVYTYALNDSQQKTFQYLSLTFDEYTQKIPLEFLLGFYISAIVKRWWDQFELIGWPEETLNLLCVLIPDRVDKDARLKRHTVARYMLLTAALAWRDISVKVRQRFPTVDYLVSCGLMTQNEYDLYKVQPENMRWFLPIEWATKIVSDTVMDKNLPAPIASTFFKELNTYQTTFRKLYCYDWVCIPLVYTQVAALATYGYFTFCLIGRQFIKPEKALNAGEGQVDLYVPLFTIVQFLFYIGWFKVGQDLMRPFGTDDDDIEMNYILDRHIQTSFALVDSVHDQSPPLVEDRFFKEQWVPHTKLSAKSPDNPPKLHAQVKIKDPEDGEIEMDNPDGVISTVSFSENGVYQTRFSRGKDREGKRPIREF